jgi:hypothetical protein
MDATMIDKRGGYIAMRMPAMIKSIPKAMFHTSHPAQTGYYSIF